MDTLRGGIRAGVEIFAAYRDVFRALHSMDQLEPEAVGGAIGRIEEQRAEGMAWLARRLSRGKLLQPRITATEAAHVLWIATSGFDGLRRPLHGPRPFGRRRPRDLLVAIAERTLLV